MASIRPKQTSRLDYCFFSQVPSATKKRKEEKVCNLWQTWFSLAPLIIMGDDENDS